MQLMDLRCAAPTLALVATIGTLAGAAYGADNIVPIEVRQFAPYQHNKLFVELTVCNRSHQCRIVPQVLVDTGSVGVRLSRGALGGLELDAEKDAEGRPVGAWARFGSGDLWGTVNLAQVRIGKLATLRPIPIQVIDRPERRETLPPGYGDPDARLMAIDMANGILGISPQRHQPNGYFVESRSAAGDDAGSWHATQLQRAMQIANPIADLPVPYDGGSVIRLPEVDPASGDETASGELGLGIGAATDRLFPPHARIVAHQLDAAGMFRAAISGHEFDVLIDSGTNALSLDLKPLGVALHPRHPYYDAPATQQFHLDVRSGDALVRLQRPLYVGATVKYLKANQRHGALPMVVGWDPHASRQINVLGLPFFYGRTVATGLSDTVNPFQLGAPAALEAGHDGIDLQGHGGEPIDDEDGFALLAHPGLALPQASTPTDAFEVYGKAQHGYIAYSD